MFSWYQVFILAVIGLRVVASPRDRNALSIILVASFVSTLLVNFVTREIHAPWKLVFPATVETLTIIAMLTWAKNRTGYMQAVCLLVAWLAHVLCYLDIALGTDLVYERYEALIQLVAAAQILVCYDTLARCGGLIVDWFNSVRDGGGVGLRVAGMHHSLLHGEAAPVVQTAGRVEKISRV